MNKTLFILLGLKYIGIRFPYCKTKKIKQLMKNKQTNKQKAKENKKWLLHWLVLIIYPTAINDVGPLDLIVFKMCKNPPSDNSSKTGKDLVINGEDTNFFL